MRRTRLGLPDIRLHPGAKFKQNTSAIPSFVHHSTCTSMDVQKIMHKLMAGYVGMTRLHLGLQKHRPRSTGLKRYVRIAQIQKILPIPLTYPSTYNRRP